MKTIKPLARALRLEIASDPAPGELVNLIRNPDGELGGWGWVTPVPGSTLVGGLVAGLRSLTYTSPGGVASHLKSEPMPMTAGQWAAASLQIPAAPDGFYRMSLEWLDSNRNPLSTTAPSDYLSAAASYGPFQAPASTAFLRLQLDHYANTSGGNPTAGAKLYFRHVTVAAAATSAELGTIRTNLLTNPSFETDLTGWSAAGTVSLARDTAEHADGVASVKVTNTRTATRTNLVTNPSFETGVAGWVVPSDGTGTTFAQSAAQAYAGTKSVLVTCDAGSGIGTIRTGNMAVTAGQTYTAQCQFRHAAIQGSFFLRLLWVNAAGNEFATNSPGVAQSAMTWTQAVLTATAPAGAVNVRVQLVSYVSNVYVDAVMVEQAVTAGSYFDGATANTALETYAWTGTAHASTSTQVTRLASASNSGPVATAVDVVPGQYYTVSLSLKHAASATDEGARLYLAWQDSGGATVGFVFLPVGPDTAAWQRFSHTVTAPGTASKLRVYLFYDSLDPVGDHYVDAVMVEQSRDLGTFIVGTQSYSSLLYIEPGAFVDILGPTHDITVVRESLNIGTLTANIVDSSLDPSQSELIRPGRAVRLMAYESAGARWRHVFTGQVKNAKVAYELKEPRAEKRARIELTAVDNAQVLANQKRSEGVATIDELPYVLEGAGTPWNCNGNGGQVASSTVVAINDSASALDQVAVTRDSVLGYAWVDRMGVLQAWDRDQISMALAGPVLDESVYRDVVVAYDPEADLINEVNLKFIRYDPGTGETEEIPYGPYRAEASIAEWGVRSSEFTIQGLAEETADLEAYAEAVLDANSVPVVRLNSMDLHVDLTPDWSAVAGDDWYAWVDLYDLIEIDCERASIEGQQSRVTGIKHTLSGPESKWMIELGFTASTTVASPTFVPSPTTGAGGKTIGQLLRPCGEITMWFGPKADIPAGWLPCDGTTFSGTDYPDLAALLGGTTLPNFTDRMPIGAGTKALGTSGGDPTKVIGPTNLPPHAHTITHTHTINHDHTIQSRNAANGANTDHVVSAGGATAATANTAPNTFTGSSGGASPGSGGNGPGTSEPLDVMNPWRALWFLIRAR